MIVTNDNIAELAWQKMDNLLPAIIQHSDTGAVLMQGYMNQEALTATLNSSKATFFSRSKQRLWVKGESSGNFLNVLQVLSDCDQDALLISARPQGPTCHLGTNSCFPEEVFNQKNFLGYLEHVIETRKDDKPEESYTAHLLSRGTARVAQKVGEEGVEVALAAATNQKDEFIGECADLFYHTLVLLADQGVDMNTVMAKLQERHK
ncbi:bifunctional phosphoribosyl-AMP cyclohydrolase/phosphoribosyl-ATP diphosphatase HisIE [Thalassotalea crassostreae]|uniref:bifunctional phosphoribosyl-AMP cyclohydrolase/phosphoribosyl-ATP diphosphatase HisIE n=1 Tax=Thalassotalea crassostreae TaxID=1763536 RepID=UPI00083804B4|nr:bifunctional phosphoribosyl-AMP cyclohydrolase/phosphoribosyl-ATP diphosphatase HisIE [Thalassotalea crassostreae]